MKTRTIIIDIDGIIFKHFENGPSDQWFSPPEVLPGVHEQFDKWESESACIILMTARKESCRPLLEERLCAARIFYDQLIMGVGHGERVLINDAKPDSKQCRVIGVEIPRNEGLKEFENFYNDSLIYD